MADETWLKLWRKSLKSAAFADAHLWKVWSWCLMHAAYEERFVPMQTGRGQTIVQLEPGQLIWGRKAAGRQLRMKPRSAENRMLRLVNMGNLDRQVDTHWTVLTIRHWARYNGDRTEDGQATGQAKGRQRAGKGQAKGTVKEGKTLRSRESSSAREQLEAVTMELPGKMTAMMMLPIALTAEQIKAMTELLAEVARDPEGERVVAAVMKAFNDRMADGDVAHPIAYLRTLVDDIGPQIRREACQSAEEEEAGGVERAQDLREREAEDEHKRTDPAAFRAGVEAHAQTAAFFRKRSRAQNGVPHCEDTGNEREQQQKNSAAALCCTLGIEQPPVGWDSVEGG